MAGNERLAGSQEQNLPSRVADRVAVEFDPVQNALARVDVEQHGRTIELHRASILGAHVDIGSGIGLTAAIGLEQHRRAGGGEIHAIGEVHQRLHGRGEAVVHVQRRGFE